MNQINASDFQKEILDSPIPVLVDFFAEWCGPCKMQTPVLQELSSTWEGKVKIVKVDVDQNNELAGQFGVMSIPTLIVFKNGKPQNQMIGFQQKEKLEQLFQEISK
jgi:thioredoxin 1